MKECTSTSGTQCRDSSSGKIWSAPSSITKTWSDAKKYCNNLSQEGFDDWHLPSVDELRTFITNCPNLETGGSCGVTNSCSSSSCKTDCTSCSQTEDHSKLGITGNFWTSSSYSFSYTTGTEYYNVGTASTTYAWYINFTYGAIKGGPTVSYTQYDTLHHCSDTVNAVSNYAICVRSE